MSTQHERALAKAQALVEDVANEKASKQANPSAEKNPASTALWWVLGLGAIGAAAYYAMRPAAKTQANPPSKRTWQVVFNAVPGGNVNAAFTVDALVHDDGEEVVRGVEGRRVILFTETSNQALLLMMRVQIQASNGTWYDYIPEGFTQAPFGVAVLEDNGEEEITSILPSSTMKPQIYSGAPVSFVQVQSFVVTKV